MTRFKGYYTKILILGSSYLTELCVKALKGYNLVGYVPCKNTPVFGNVPLPEVDINTDCDIKLSLQYDQYVEDTSNTYNLHTGLLPEYGGRDILDHTIKNRSKEQGLTFHKMTDKMDYGPIISTVTYPVLETDTSFDLYKRMLHMAPSFLRDSMLLLSTLSDEQIEGCRKYPPQMYKRGDFELSDEFKAFIKERNVKCKKY